MEKILMGCGIALAVGFTIFVVFTMVYGMLSILGVV